MKKETMYVRICPCCGAPLGTSESDKCEYCGAVFTEEQKTQSKWIVNARHLALLSDAAFNTYSRDFHERAQLELSEKDFTMQKGRVIAEANRRVDQRMKNRFPWILCAIISLLFAGFFLYHMVLSASFLFSVAFVVFLIISLTKSGQIDEDDADEIGDFLPEKVEKSRNKRFLFAGLWCVAAIIAGLLANYAANNGMKTMAIIAIVATVVCLVMTVIQIMRK